MQYFVILPDGQKFGPADLATLNQWAAEGRIVAGCEIEDLATRVRTPATAMPGLTIPGTQAATGTSKDWNQPPTAGSPYPRSGYGTGTSPGQTELTVAWILGAVTFAFCCPVLPGVGLYFANKSLSLGNPGAQAAKIFNLVVLILSGLVYLGYAIFFIAMISTAGFK